MESYLEHGLLLAGGYKPKRPTNNANELNRSKEEQV